MKIVQFNVQGGQGGLLSTPNNLVTNVEMTKITHEKLFILRAKSLVRDETTKNRIKISVMS